MTKKNNDNSALKVNEGISQPSSVNPYLSKKRKSEKCSTETIFQGIINGDMRLLSKAITLIESSNQEHHKQSQEIVEKCLPYAGNSVRIGITGVPGVGKSTFIESFGKSITSKNYKLAVLAIDPSSNRTKGSILGDKTRMVDLSADENAFIRPSPSSGSLGGVARKTRESIILCEAAGFDVIFVETVGVGQSEIAVHSMVDFFLLLMLAGAGDELQGIKRGIMEMADAILINKADGNNVHMANLAKTQYRSALHLFPPTESGWVPVVETCSAQTGENVDKVWGIIENYAHHVKENGFFQQRRNNQNKMIMYDSVNESLKNDFYHNENIKQMLPQIEKELLELKKSSYMAANELLKKYYTKE